MFCVVLWGTIEAEELKLWEERKNSLQTDVFDVAFNTRNLLPQEPAKGSLAFSYLRKGRGGGRNGELHSTAE